MTLSNWLALAMGPLFAALVFLSWQSISQRSSLPGPLDLAEILEKKYGQPEPDRSRAARALPVLLILAALILLLYSVIN